MAKKRAMVLVGNCLEVMLTLPACSVDSIVTDPPYGLSFMGKDWDHGVPGEHFWREALRVAKPGAYLLAFGGTRTFHRLTVAIEDAGWEIRDCVMWVYGSGFPKSHDVSKAIDKAAGIAMESRGHFRFTSADTAETPGAFRTNEERANPGCRKSPPSTDLAKQWQGWGTALKPAWEPIIVARKPLEGTVAENVTKYGTGAMNVDGGRVAHGSDVNMSAVQRQHSKNPLQIGGAKPGDVIAMYKPGGRWPANLIHDGSDEVVGLMPQTTSGKPCGKRNVAGFATAREHGTELTGFGDSGSAARFFYCAKASKADRGNDNRHPTVKPIALMRYLCKLVTQPNGVILDPFTGSGSTGKAAVLEGFRFIGIELSDEYAEIARARISATIKEQA